MWAARHALIPSLGVAVVALALTRPTHTAVAPALDVAVAVPVDAPVQTRSSDDPPPRCEFPPVEGELAALSGDGLLLARLWRARHPCDELPRCGYVDRIAAISGDFDDSPGRERVIGSARFGVAMLAANGGVLASSEPIACGTWSDAGQGITLGAQPITSSRHRDIVVHSRFFAHCGELKSMTVLHREGDLLAASLELDEGGFRGCNVWETEHHSSVTLPRLGVVVQRSWGRTHEIDQAAGDPIRYLPWQAFDQTCTWTAGADAEFRAEPTCRGDGVSR